MQFSIKKNNRFNTIAFFALVLFFAFLPVSSFLFHIKNDAFINYFPPKFFMSESLGAGYLPLWNPYINFGIPQYADMNAGYWSPITWLIAGTVGYNVYSFTIEVLLYLLLSGIGMYKLSGLFMSARNIRLMAAVAFMCCGYHIGHLQHFNWLSASAFLPFCMWAYIKFTTKPDVKNIMVAALFFYLFIASAHPGHIIGAIYFFSAIAVYVFFSKKNIYYQQQFWQFLKNHFFLIIALLVLSVGIILAYTDIIPHFMRGDKPALEATLQHSSNINTWISLILPMATVKNDAFFVTDLSLRNSYFGLLFLLFLLICLFSSKTGWQKLLFFTGIFFLLLSTGGFFKNFAYHYLPFIGYVRLGGEFRIFTIISFVLIAAIQLDKYFKANTKVDLRKLKWVSIGIAGILVAAIIFALFNIISQKSSIIFQGNFVSSGTVEKLKAAIDAVTFYDTLFIQAIIQLVVLWVVFRCIINKKLTLLKWILVADMVLASLLNIPFTGVGKTSLSHVQTVLNKSPKGIPLPVLQPLNKNEILIGSDSLLLGHWSMYNKQIGTLTEMPYPIQLKNMRAFFDRANDDSSFNYAQKSYLYSPDSSTMFSVTNFSPNQIDITVEAQKNSGLIFLQNYYPHWYYENNKGRFKIEKEDLNFMRIPADKNEKSVRLIFDPGFIKYAIPFTGFVFLIYLMIAIYYKAK